MSTKKKQYSVTDLEKRYGCLTLGRFLSSWRLSEGLTQKEFAKKLGMSPANLCDIEKGRKGVSLVKANEIARAIGYPPTMLVQLALQEQISSSGLAFSVQIKAA